MRNLKFLLLAVFVVAVSSLAGAQDFQPPPPLKNEAFEMSLGEWAAVPYEMMGTKIVSEDVNIYMKHGQFMLVDIMGKNGNGETYTGTVVLTADANGNLKGYSFDIWGGDWMMTYTGKAEGNVISLHGTNDLMSENRTITIEGDKMTEDVDFTLKMPTGDMNEKITVVYNKK
ncbi:MAG: hypothetical protein KDC42_05225 [Ignavibacteriae bacterium]|nr:hypothetical protein [Ignavibacteriota bacterium]